MEDKATEINYGIVQIQGILQMLRPEKKWRIVYKKVTDAVLDTLTDWQKQYHGIRKNEEYFFIWDEEGCLLYVLNVSAESTLYSLSNLLKLLADKF